MIWFVVLWLTVVTCGLTHVVTYGMTWQIIVLEFSVVISMRWIRLLDDM